jgi:oligopeptide/dipeptide ABC transporter ATP-binding protein
MTGSLVEVRHLSVHFPMREGLVLPGRPRRVVRAVENVTFDIKPGEVLAMVGESGCGKTTIGKTILRLVNPSSGGIFYQGVEITRMKGAEMRQLRRRIQLIFQDPYESLDPRQSVFNILAEPMRIHFPDMIQTEMKQRVYSALESTGLYPVQDIALRYPHHLSGGQRQRVAIAAAMILEPEFIVTDEPVSMLDVSIRADILKLMLDLRDKKQLTYLFITHDLSLAWMIASRILVLYLGKIVEIGEADTVIHRAKHPYTKALVSVIPLPRPDPDRKPIILEGETPSPLDMPSGCHFRQRCWLWRKLGRPELCSSREPELQAGEDADHTYACHYAMEV